MYLIVCAAAAVLDRRDVRADRAPLRLPGGPTIPVLSCAIIVALLSTLGRRELVATAVMVALASLPYWFQRLRSRSTA